MQARRRRGRLLVAAARAAVSAAATRAAAAPSAAVTLGAMRMGGAAVLGIFWQQLAGIGHDLGHSGVTHNFWRDHLLGSMLSAFMGLSVGWWKSDHNTHHVVCNAIEHDPNVLHLPLTPTLT